jgi:hypothetical protein
MGRRKSKLHYVDSRTLIPTGHQTALKVGEATCRKNVRHGAQKEKGDRCHVSTRLVQLDLISSFAGKISKTMTEPLIQNLDLLDTEYADAIAQSRDLIGEAKERQIYQQIVAWENNPEDVEAKARFLSLLGNPVVNDAQFEILISAWKDACGYKS